jgi:hypothetical protein
MTKTHLLTILFTESYITQAQNIQALGKTFNIDTMIGKIIKTTKN